MQVSYYMLGGAIVYYSTCHVYSSRIVLFTLATRYVNIPYQEDIDDGVYNGERVAITHSQTGAVKIQLTNFHHCSCGFSPIEQKWYVV